MSYYGAIGGDGTTEIVGRWGADEDLLDALSMGQDGTYEIVGSEYDIVGARARGNAGRTRREARQIEDRNAILVKRGNLEERRRFPIGFARQDVAAGDSVLITAPPQNLFRTERLVLPSDIAFDFQIEDFKVGNESQFVAGGEVPGALFTEVAIDTDVHFKTAEVGNQISIQVINSSADTVEFRAGCIGTVAR